MRIIDWEKIYNHMRKEKYFDMTITGNQYINYYKKINKNNLVLFYKYHKYAISNFPEYDDLYDFYIDYVKDNEKSIYLKSHKKFNREILDTLLAEGNFRTHFSYHKRADEYIEINKYSILTKYKHKRKDIIRFLLDNDINSIELTNMNQEHFDKYKNNIINSMNSYSIEPHINSIKDFLLFHKDKIKSINFDIYESEIYVPTWDTMPPIKEQANSEQIDFYTYWLHNYNNDIIIDINGVLHYLFLYLYDIIGDFILTKNIAKLNKEFKKMNESYGHYHTIKKYLYLWLKDAYTLIGDKKKYLEYKIKYHIHCCFCQ